MAVQQDSLPVLLPDSIKQDSTVQGSDSTRTAEKLLKPVTKEPAKDSAAVYPNFFHTNHSSDLYPSPALEDRDNWIIPLLLGIFFLAAIIHTVFSKASRGIFNALFKRDGLRKLMEEENIIQKRTLMLSLSLFLLIFPVFIYQLANHFELTTAFVPFLPPYAQLLLISAGLLGFKVFSIHLLGYLFNCKTEAGNYNVGILVMYSFLGLLLIPVTLGIKLSTGEIEVYFTLAGIAFFALSYLISLGIGISAGLRSSALSKFHLILYFCTLEILPVILIVKAVRNIL